MKRSASLRNAVSAISTLAIFAVLFSRMNWAEISVSFKNINVPSALTAIMIALFSIVVLGVGRLKITLKIFGHLISFKEAFIIRMGSMPLKVLPSGKWNLLSQIVYLKRNRNFSVSSGIHVAVLPLFLDFFSCLVLIIPSGLYWIFIKKTEHALWLQYAVFLSAIAAVFSVLVFALLKSKLFQEILLSWIKRVHFPWQDKICVFFEAYRIVTYQEIFFLLLYSMVFQYSALFVYSLLAYSLGLQIPLLSIMLFVPIVVILTTIPITFAGLGVREALILFFFSSYGSSEAILSLGILFSLSEHIIPVFFGLVFTKSFISKLILGRPGDMGAIQDISG